MLDSYSFYKDKLTGEYRECFDLVEAYSMMRNVGKDKWEEQMMDLLDVFLSAQRAGKPVEKIVGNDVAKFSESFCRQNTFSDYMRGFADAVKRIAWLILIFMAFEVLIFWGEEPFWQRKTSIIGFVSGLFIGLCVSFLAELVARKCMKHFKKFSMRMFHWLLVIQIILSVSIVMGVMHWLEEDALALPIWLVILCAAIYLAGYYFLTRNTRKRMEKVRFVDKVAEQLPGELIKQFEKKNNKLVQKGKAQQTEMEYLDELIAQYEKGQKQKKWIWLVPVAFLLLCIFLTWLNEGFESFGDFLIFLLLAGGAGFLCGLPFWLLNRGTEDAKIRWARASREQGGFIRDGEVRSEE